MPRVLLTAMFGLLLLVSPARAADQWATYTNTEYGFSLDLPGVPDGTDVPAKNVTVVTFAVSNDWRSYGATIIPLKEGMVYDLDKGVAGGVDANGGTVVSDEAITFQGYPGRKVKFTGKSGDTVVTTWFIMVYKPGIVYSAMAIQFGQVTQEEVDRVLNSFRILE